MWKGFDRKPNTIAKGNPFENKTWVNGRGWVSKITPILQPYETTTTLKRGGLVNPYSFKYNYKHRFEKGGLLETTHLGHPPKVVILKMKTHGVDQIPALLQQGELVIPKKRVKLVEGFLIKNHIHLPHMPYKLH